MRRGMAVTWHLVSFLISAALYFFFVLPRWPELTGDTSHTLGTVLRIATGSLFGLSALPVVFTLIETRKPEFGTPQLALSLRRPWHRPGFEYSPRGASAPAANARVGV